MITNKILHEYEGRLESYLHNLAENSLRPVLKECPDFMDTCVAEKDSSVRKRIEAEFFGLGPLSGLMDDPLVTEIMINSYDQIFYERGSSVERLADSFVSAKSYRNFISRFILENEINPDLRKPTADGKWRNFRFHLILEPLAKATTLTLRRQSQKIFPLTDFFDQSMAANQALVEVRSWLKNDFSFLIFGPTNTGKTSFLSCLMSHLPKSNRVLTIEDTDELILPNSISTKLLTRNSLDKDLLSYDQSDLVIQSLRMRPDRLVMGEIRGGEAKDFLLALSTGHKGSIGTLHSEDPHQALLRLEFLVQMGAPHWSVQAIRKLIKTSLYGLIELGRFDGKRQIRGLYKIASLEPSGFCIETLFQK